MSRGTTFASKSKALVFTSGVSLTMTDGAVTSQSDAGIECDGGDVVLAGTKVSGASSAINGKSGLKLEATKNTSFVATAGNGIDTTSNAQVTLADATVGAARAALRSASPHADRASR